MNESEATPATDTDDDPTAESDEGSIEIIGTVHTSEESKTRVEDAIRDSDPDVVAVELAEPRFRAHFRDDTPNESSGSLPGSGLRGKGVFLFLHYYQRFQLRRKGIDGVGADMDLFPAVENAFEQDIPVALVDAPIHNSIQKLSRTFSIKGALRTAIGSKLSSRIDGLSPEKRRAYHRLIDIFEEYGDGWFSTFLSPQETLEQIPEPVLDEIDEVIRTAFPEQYRIMVGNRNRKIAGYLHHLRQQGYSVVVILGRLHKPGVRRLLDTPEDIPFLYVQQPPIRDGSLVSQSTEQ